MSSKRIKRNNILRSLVPGMPPGKDLGLNNMVELVNTFMAAMIEVHEQSGTSIDDLVEQLHTVHIPSKAFQAGLTELLTKLLT